MSNPKNTRRCIVCHEHADKSEMIRFFMDKDGKVCVDRSKKRTAGAFGCMKAASAKQNLSRKNAQFRIQTERR